MAMAHWLEARRPLMAALAGLTIIIVALGAVLDIAHLYRPLPGAGGTHPLTLLIAALLVLSLLGSRRSGFTRRLRRPRLLSILPAGLALLLLGLRTAEMTAAAPLAVVPAMQALPGWALALLQTQPGSMTSPAAVLALACVAFAQVLRPRTPLGAGLVLMALVVCASVLVALSYGLPGSFSGLSPSTLPILALLACAAGTRHLDPLILRLLLSPAVAGRLLRRQMALGLVAVWVSGGLLLRIEASDWVRWAPLLVAAALACVVAGLMWTLGVLARTETLRQRHLARVERLSVTDVLTGLANRRATDLFARQAVAQANRSGEGLSVILLDLDSFKAVNDRFGHSGGDAVLRQTGRMLGRWLRRSDLACRWGGEEFLLILSGTRLIGATALAERLRRMVEEQVMLPDGSGCVTVSLGCAELLPGEEDLDAALSRADMALYRAKAAGRNRVEPQLPQDSMAVVLPGPGGGQAARRAGAKGAGPKGAATEVAGVQDSASKESRMRSVSDAKPSDPTAWPNAASGVPVAGASRATDAVTWMAGLAAQPEAASPEKS